MSNLATVEESRSGLVFDRSQSSAIVEKVIAENGDLSRLTAIERKTYYLCMCDRYNLDPFMNPFDYLEQRGKDGTKLTLYPNQKAANQWASQKRISTTIKSREFVEGLCIITVVATKPDGMVAEATGVAELSGYGGKPVAIKKAETQARRRAVLVLCGFSSGEDDPGSEIHAEYMDPPMDAVDIRDVTEIPQTKPFNRKPTYDAIKKAMGLLKLSKDDASRMTAEFYGKNDVKSMSDDELIDFADFLEAKVVALNGAIAPQVEVEA